MRLHRNYHCTVCMKCCRAKPLFEKRDSGSLFQGHVETHTITRAADCPQRLYNCTRSSHKLRRLLFCQGGVITGRSHSSFSPSVAVIVQASHRCTSFAEDTAPYDRCGALRLDHLAVLNLEGQSHARLRLRLQSEGSGLHRNLKSSSTQSG